MIIMQLLLSKEELLKLYVWVDFLRVRKEPNQKRQVIEELTQGSMVEYQNDKTTFSEEIRLHGKMFFEPWLRVKTDKNTGWVYGGALRPQEPVVKLCATAFPNPEGTRLVTVNYNFANGDRFNKVICSGGISYTINFLERKPVQTGVTIAANFANYGGYYYKIIDGIVSSNETGFLISADFLKQRTLLKFKPLINQKCNPAVIRKIESIKGWVVKDSWSLIKLIGSITCHLNLICPFLKISIE